MPFAKGNKISKGRPKGVPNKATCEIKELAQSYGPEVLQELLRLARHADNEAVRVSAGKEVLDRGYGKARQPMDVAGSDGGPIEIAFTFQLDSASSDDD